MLFYIYFNSEGNGYSIQHINPDRKHSSLYTINVSLCTASTVCKLCLCQTLTDSNFPNFLPYCWTDILFIGIYCPLPYIISPFIEFIWSKIISIYHTIQFYKFIICNNLAECF